MGCALAEVRDVKEYVTGLGVTSTGRRLLLEVLIINSQSCDHLELASKEGIRLFSGGDEFNIIDIQ